MTDASRLASQLTNYPAVTLTASAGVTIRRFDLIYLDANSFIIVLLLSDEQQQALQQSLQALTDEEKQVYRCKYCEEKYSR